MERVCENAAQDGFDFVVAYPNKAAVSDTSHFSGYFEMYRKSGFTVHCETEHGLVMRKKL